MNKSLEEHFNNWIEHLQKVRDLSQNTIISYKHDVTKFVEFIFIHNDKDLMSLISDIKDAKVEDGGSGAFYIYLRKKPTK